MGMEPPPRRRCPRCSGSTGAVPEHRQAGRRLCPSAAYLFHVASSASPSSPRQFDYNGTLTARRYSSQQPRCRSSWAASSVVLVVLKLLRKSAPFPVRNSVNGLVLLHLLTGAYPISNSIQPSGFALFCFSNRRACHPSWAACYIHHERKHSTLASALFSLLAKQPNSLLLRG